MDNRILTTVFSSLFLGSFGLAIIGVVGMLFFWSPSRYLFLVSLIIRTLVMSLHYKWICITNLHGFFVAAENFLEGAIMALCLVGPAKNLFKKKRH